MTYAGDLTLDETWALLKDNPDTVLIDVRTQEEWDTVGVPDLSSLDKTPRFVQWNMAGGVPNSDFVSQARAHLGGPDTPIVLLCRTGGRSAAAAQALTAEGFGAAFNIAGGFEGPGAAGNGWADNLPSGANNA